LAANLDDHSPIITDIVDFDRGSGSVIERLLFNNRPIILLVCLLATLFFGYQATKVQLNADFNKMIPTQQPYIVNFFKHYDELQSQGNAIWRC
jgi:predicted RND superfamily exporter protein